MTIHPDLLPLAEGFPPPMPEQTHSSDDEDIKAIEANEMREKVIDCPNCCEDSQDRQKEKRPVGVEAVQVLWRVGRRVGEGRPRRDGANGRCWRRGDTERHCSVVNCAKIVYKICCVVVCSLESGFDQRGTTQHFLASVAEGEVLFTAQQQTLPTSLTSHLFHPLVNF
jgi:hypothetical protein